MKARPPCFICRVFIFDACLNLEISSLNNNNFYFTNEKYKNSTVKIYRLLKLFHFNISNMFRLVVEVLKVNKL